MAKRLALAGLFLSTLLIGAAYASAFLPGGTPPWAAWAMAVGTAAVMVSAMMLGAERRGGIGRLWIPFAFTFLVIAGGFGAVLALPPADPADPALWLGLPPRAAVVMYGIGLLPLFVVPVAYALTFEERTLSRDDLERVRAAARAFRERTDTEEAPREKVAATAAAGGVR